MDRKQALVLVKELYVKCPHMEGKSLKLRQTDLTNPFSFEIEIRMGSYRLIKPYVMRFQPKTTFQLHKTMTC
jgi:hypothetical protein